MRGDVKCPRKIKHLAAVADYLESIGADITRIEQNGHIHISYLTGGRSMRTMMSSTPRSIEDCIRGTIRRVKRDLRAEGVEVRP